MKNIRMIELAELTEAIERKACDLDANADATPSMIVRAVNQGQAMVLRELIGEISSTVGLGAGWNRTKEKGRVHATAPLTKSAAAFDRATQWYPVDQLRREFRATSQTSTAAPAIGGRHDNS